MVKGLIYSVVCEPGLPRLLTGREADMDFPVEENPFHPFLSLYSLFFFLNRGTIDLERGVKAREGVRGQRKGLREGLPILLGGGAPTLFPAHHSSR